MDCHEIDVIKLNNRNRKLNEHEEYRKRNLAGFYDNNGVELKEYEEIVNENGADLNNIDYIGAVGATPIIGDPKKHNFEWKEYEEIVNENGADLNMDNEGYSIINETKLSTKDKFSEAISEKLRFSRFNEDKIIKTLVDYIATTYGQHYVDGDKQTQTIETIRNDRIPGFCIGNITKYLDRYDKKGTPRSDLLKAAHYLILLLNHENIYD